MKTRLRARSEKDEKGCAEEAGITRGVEEVTVEGTRRERMTTTTYKKIDVLPSLPILRRWCLSWFVRRLRIFRCAFRYLPKK
jgi:hypothetical protein